MGFLDKLLGFFKKSDGSVVDNKEESTDEVVTVESLAEEQKLIDELYARDGLTDTVLDLQVALNEKRNKYDISDKNNLNDEGWSQ